MAAAALLAGLLVPAWASGATEPAEERWFVLELAGRPAGWSVERWWSEDGRVVTESELALRVARGPDALELDIAGRLEETSEGEPVLLWTRRALGSEPVETTYRFTPAGVVAESEQAGRRRKESVARPEGAWLTPAEARREVARHHAAGDREYALRMLDPLEGLEPVTLRRTWIGDAESPGAAGRWREESSSAPGVPSTVDLDAVGEVVRSTTEILGLQATLRRTDRKTALAVRSGAGGARRPGRKAPPAAPEVLEATLVRPDRPIPAAHEVREAVYELSLSAGSMPDLPSDGAQRVERQGDRLRVAVTAVPPEGSAPSPQRPPDADPVPGGAGDPALLAPSLYLDFEDPAVRRLLDLAAPRDADPPARDAATRSIAAPHSSPRRALALALTRFVHGYVAEKGLDTGFATASEVARSRRGDCTEHAVLLAALLRAAGIPSRAVAGLVYLDRFAGAREVFGYHMWAQAWVDGRWLDLDPTLPWGFDATHIALGISDLAGPDGGAALDRILPMVGKLRIEVLELER